MSLHYFFLLILIFLKIHFHLRPFVFIVKSQWMFFAVAVDEFSTFFILFFFKRWPWYIFFLCVCVRRSRTGLCCLPTSLCQHASGSAVGCDVLLHVALPWTGQWGSSWGNRGNNIAALETYSKIWLFALTLKGFRITPVFFFDSLQWLKWWWPVSWMNFINTWLGFSRGRSCLFLLFVA